MPPNTNRCWALRSSEASVPATSGTMRAMQSFFSSLKTEPTARKAYRTRNEAGADAFDYIERFYNATRRHSTIGYISPVEFERKAGLA
jgi:putative transposase